MRDAIVLKQLAAPRREIFLDHWCPLFDNLVYVQVVFVEGHDFLGGRVQVRIEIVLEYHVSELEHKEWIPHLPYTQGSPLKIALHPISIALVQKFGPNSCLGRRREDCLLELAIRQIVLVQSVEHSLARGVRNLHHHVAEATHAFEFGLVKVGSAPVGQMRPYVIEDGLV